MLVAIDGIDGAGKSTFADELAAELRRSDVPVVRSTVDSFHNPPAVRYRRGKTSPVGFFLDSHNLDAVRTELLDPFAEGIGNFRIAAYDVEQEQPVEPPPQPVEPDQVLVFDGIFLQREELVGYWDLVIFLDGQQRVNQRRLGYVLADLPATPTDVVAHVLDWHAKIDRYSSGMRYYLDLVDAIESADVVIDNNDLAAPRMCHTMAIDHEIVVNAPAEQVYAMVSDITRIGEWSPECIRSEWTQGEPGAVGSQFVGSNYERNAETGQEWSWEMTSEVVDADAPRTFAWSVLTEAWDINTSVWRFSIEPRGGSCLLRQQYRMARPPQGWQPILDRHGFTKQVEFVATRRARLDRGMQTTLAAIAAAIES